jgi:hypothetical protein
MRDLMKRPEPQSLAPSRKWGYTPEEATGDLDRARGPGQHDDEAGDEGLAGVFVAQEITEVAHN